MKTRIMSKAQMSKCPKLSLLPAHFRDDGTCECQHKEENDKLLALMHAHRRMLRAAHKKIVKQIEELKRKR